MEVSWTVIVTSLCACALSYSSRVQLFATPWTIYSPPGPSVHGILHATTLDGLPCPPPGDLPHQGRNPHLMSPALAGGFFTTSATQEAQHSYTKHEISLEDRLWQNEDKQPLKKKKKGRVTAKKPKKEIKCNLKKYLINLRDRSKKREKETRHDK